MSDKRGLPREENQFVNLFILKHYLACNIYYKESMHSQMPIIASRLILKICDDDYFGRRYIPFHISLRFYNVYFLTI